MVYERKKGRGPYRAGRDNLLRQNLLQNGGISFGTCRSPAKSKSSFGVLTMTFSRSGQTSLEGESQWMKIVEGVARVKKH